MLRPLHSLLDKSAFFHLFNSIWRLGLLVTCLALHCSVHAKPATSSVVGLVYHHVSESTPPSTSISPVVFAEHLAYINEHFTVLPLVDVVNALQQGKPVPENTLVITFDDGYRNILENGHPLLKKYNFPYTIFINPESIGQRADQLNWQQIKQMEKQGVTFANHTYDHLHMLNRLPQETNADWLQRVWANVEKAQKILTEKLSTAPKYLAYPFGEYNRQLADKLLEEGYVGFAQHSGGMSFTSDFSALPRFPSAGIYANLRSLKTKMHSLAMPVVQVQPNEPETKPGSKVAFSFKVTSDDVRVNQLNCFYQGEVIAATKTDNAISVNLDKTLPVGRSRVNCTAPSKSLSGRYYWYSHPFFVPNAQGLYPD